MLAAENRHKSLMELEECLILVVSAKYVNFLCSLFSVFTRIIVYFHVASEIRYCSPHNVMNLGYLIAVFYPPMNFLAKSLRGLGRGRFGSGYFTRVYPKVSGLAAWSENCKWYSSLPLGALVSLFCESV
jgi:hypothetical protein